jgi:Zn-dependent protease
MGWYNLRTQEISAVLSSILPSIPEVITYVIILLTAFPVHEFAHAWTANHFGDDTPRRQGRLTLNPLAHLDLFGSLMLLLVGFGWAKPVMVNEYAIRRRSSAGPMWVALAGPLSNFAMAILAAIPFRLGLVTMSSIGLNQNTILPSLAYFLFLFIYVNLFLMLFNLLPLSPLDGEKVLGYFLPPNLASALESIRPYGSLILMALIFVLPMVGIDVIGIVITPTLSFLALLLVG